MIRAVVLVAVLAAVAYAQCNTSTCFVVDPFVDCEIIPPTTFPKPSVKPTKFPKPSKFTPPTYFIVDAATDRQFTCCDVQNDVRGDANAVDNDYFKWLPCSTDSITASMLSASHVRWYALQTGINGVTDTTTVTSANATNFANMLDALSYVSSASLSSGNSFSDIYGKGAGSSAASVAASVALVAAALAAML